MLQRPDASPTLEILGSTRRQSHPAEWSALLTRHPNVLCECPGTSTEAFLSILKPHLREPIVWQQQGAPLDLHADHLGALVLQDVAALDPEQQGKLSQWLQDAGRHRQVVSTTTTPLYPLVERGQFDATLYYRLNVILLRL